MFPLLLALDIQGHNYANKMP